MAIISCVQLGQLPTSLGDSYRASACAWSPDGCFLLTSWHGGMGMLTVHEVMHSSQMQLNTSEGKYDCQ